MKNISFKTRKTAALGLAVFCGSVFTGCLTMPEENAEGNLALVAVEIHPGKVSPTTDLRLEEMIVTLASNTGEILRDTITEAGSRLSKAPVRLNPSGDASRIIHPIYEVDPSKEWTITVKTRDARDSILHLDSARAGGLAPRMLRNVRMSLAPRFVAYEAVFALPSGMKDAVLRRVEAAVDGRTVCASETSDADSARLNCDRLPAGGRIVTLSVYGQTAGNGATRLLFKGAAEMDIGAEAPAEDLELEPADESLGAVGMQVRLGRVGHVVINVVIPEAIAF